MDHRCRELPTFVHVCLDKYIEMKNRQLPLTSNGKKYMWHNVYKDAFKHYESETINCNGNPGSEGVLPTVLQSNTLICRIHASFSNKSVYSTMVVLYSMYFKYLKNISAYNYKQSVSKDMGIQKGY